MNAVSICDLTKHYGQHRGISHLNLNIDEGDFFGFIGPNGAGKSTTIRLLLGLIRPDSGHATIFGDDICQNHMDCVSHIGYLPSETHFYAHQTVADVLKLSAHLHHCNCEKESTYLCEQLQLDTTRKIDELSFGNRKKVGIVAAMQHRPRLLILDEPTSGLDPLIQHNFFQLLQQYHHRGNTILMSSHILSEVQNHCTNAAFIREGEIVAYDTVSALMHTRSKKICIRGKVDWKQLLGATLLESTEDSCQLLYQGDMQQLLHWLTKEQVTDVTISEPNLEDIFMHYYK